MDHHGQIERRSHFLRTPERLKIVGAGDIPREPRFDADDHVAVAPDRFAREADIGAADVHGVAFRQHTGTPDVDQNAARLRRRLGGRNDFADAIRALRSRIDQSGDAVGEAQRRPIVETQRVGVDIDQPGHYQLAARVDRFDGVGRDVGCDRRDTALRDRHVTDRV